MEIIIGVSCLVAFVNAVALAFAFGFASQKFTTIFGRIFMASIGMAFATTAAFAASNLNASLNASAVIGNLVNIGIILGSVMILRGEVWLLRAL